MDKTNVVEALNEMRLSSTGATQTLLKLSQNVEKLKANIDTSTISFREATATSKEFKIVQNTLDGANQRLTSSVKDMNYQIGIVLKPYMITAINLVGDLTAFIGRNAKEVSVLVGALGSLAIGLKAINLIAKASPFGRLVAGITALASGIIYATDKLKRLYNQYKENERIAKEYWSKTAVAKREAIKNQNDYNNSLKKQKNITKAIDKLNKSYNEAIKKGDTVRAKAYEGALISLGKAYEKTTRKIKALQSQIPKDVSVKTSPVQTPKKTVAKLPKYNIDYTPPTVRIAHPNRRYRATTPTSPKNSVSSVNIEYKRQLEDLAIANKVIDDRIRKDVSSLFEYKLYKLKEEIKEYKKLGVSKEKIDKYYNIKYKKILEERSKEEERANKKALKEYAKHIEEKRKASIKNLDKEIQRINRQIKNGVGVSFGYVLVDSLRKSGLGNELSRIFKGSIGKDFLNLVKSMGSYLQSGNVQGLYSAGGSTIADLIANNGDPNSKTMQVSRGIGKAIGTAVGTALGGALGGAIGGALGDITGSTFGRLIGAFRGKKSIRYKVDEDGNLRVYKYTKRKFRSNKKKYDESRTRQLNETLSVLFENLNTSLKALGLTAVDFMKNLNTHGSYIKTKYLGENITKAIIDSVTQGLDSEAKSDMLDRWKDYAKSQKIKIEDAIIQGLESARQTQDRISLYLARKKGDVGAEYDILTSRNRSIVDTLGKQLGVTNLEEFNKKYRDALKNGALTPEELSRWNTLGNALLQLNQQRDTYIGNLKKERESIKEQIDSLSDHSRVSKEFKGLIDRTGNTLANISSRRNTLSGQTNANFNGKTHQQIQEEFNRYVSSVSGNSFIDVINVAIARQNAINAGANLETQRELTEGERLNDENLKKLNERLKKIEELLEKQNELQERTEQNTYVTAV